LSEINISVTNDEKHSIPADYDMICVASEISVTCGSLYSGFFSIEINVERFFIGFFANPYMRQSLVV
jgi:hypothetical protein